MNVIGYRKLLLTAAVFALTTALMLMKLITEASWLSLNQILLPSFLATQLVSKYLDSKRGKENDISE